MKLVMTLLVRDEQDIIAENIEFHASQGVDFFIVTDNRSVDDTPKILEGYEKAGKLHYIWEGEDNYNQHEWVTRMARLAYSDYGADWVINNDADEFWWPVQGTLKTTFLGIPSQYNAILVGRHNFVPLSDMRPPFYNQMVYREATSLNSLGAPLPPKIAHRGHPAVIVAQGNHEIRGIGELNIIANQVEIFHFPIRTYEQFVNKITKGGAAYEKNTSLPEQLGVTWRRLYREYKKEHNLKNYSTEAFYNEERIRDEISTGKLIKDCRLPDYLKQIKAV